MLNNKTLIALERQNFSRNLFVSLAHFHSLCDIKQEQLIIARLKQDDNAVKDIIEQRQIYVISGILCAVSFLEANINEILDAAKTYIYLPEARPKLEIFKKCEISVIENLAAFKDNLSRKLGTLERYQYALMISNKKPFNNAKAPYQDVDLIFDLRNLLVHYKPEWIESFAEGNSIEKDMQKIEKKLRGKFGLSKSIDEMKPFFPDRCLCYGCIDWVVKSIMIFCDDFFKRMNLVPDFKPSSIININKKGKII